MIKKALVIGGTGFLGKHLVNELIKNNIIVSVLCRNKPKDWSFNEVIFFYGNIIDQEIVHKAIEGVDCVFHLASMAGIWGSFKKYYGPNVLGTQNVIDACKTHNIPKLIYTSTPSIVTLNKSIRNGNESIKIPAYFYNNYQKTKSIAEKIVLDSNSLDLQTICIRPQAIWGDGDKHIFPRILKKLKKEKLSIVGNGNNKTSISYVKNVAWAHFQAANSKNIGGNVYFINDQIPVKLWDWINECVQSLGYKLPNKKVPYKLAFYLAIIIEFFYKISNTSSDPPFTRYTVCKISKEHYFSIEKAKRDFGYYEKYDIQEGKKEFQEYLIRIQKNI